jgi:outer membrane protein TolC
MGGKIIAGKRFANAELDYAGAELQKVSNEIIRETIERYFGVVLLQQVVKVRREVVQGMKRHERDAKRAIEIGVIPAHEVLRAQVAVANAERDFIDDRNKLELANLGLKSSMGLPDEVELEITDSLVFKLVPGQVDSLKKEAFSQQPIFKMIDQKKLMVEQKHALERSEFMPQIAAWGQYNAFGDNYPVTLPPFMVGVQAHINIFHGASKFNKLKATRYLSRQVELADQYAHEQVNLWVDKSWREVINKQERYLKMKPTVELAKKNLEINEKRFREGLGKSTDVIDARLLYEGAEVERLKSLYDYYIALSDLYLATGDAQKAVDVLNLSSN